MTPSPPTPPPDEAGREPLDQAIAAARDERRGGISPGTLTVASLASAVAAFTASHILRGSAVLTAAVTPVVVALVSEFLRRPVERVSATVAPVRPRPPTPPPGGRGPEAPRAPEPQAAVHEEDWAPISYTERTAPGWRPRWRPVLLTGLAAFVIVIGFYTIPDLLVGHSITGAGGTLTFFPGNSKPTPPTTTQTTTNTTSTPTTTVTVPSSTGPTPTDTTTTQTTTTDTTQTAPPATSTPTTSTPTTTAPVVP